MLPLAVGDKVQLIGNSWVQGFRDTVRVIAGHMGSPNAYPYFVNREGGRELRYTVTKDNCVIVEHKLMTDYTKNPYNIKVNDMVTLTGPYWAETHKNKNVLISKFENGYPCFENFQADAQKWHYIQLSADKYKPFQQNKEQTDMKKLDWAKLKVNNKNQAKLVFLDCPDTRQDEWFELDLQMAEDLLARLPTMVEQMSTINEALA